MSLSGGSNGEIRGNDEEKKTGDSPPASLLRYRP